MDDPVLIAAQSAFSGRLRGAGSVSDHTRNAQAIAKVWRGAVHALDPDRYQVEAMVSPEFDQKIDIVDTATARAYEFKVSGKNAPAEFYKDVVKVLMWNERRKQRLTELVFITDEADGRRFLDAPMPRAYVNYLRTHGLEVTVSYVKHL